LWCSPGCRHGSVHVASMHACASDGMSSSIVDDDVAMCCRHCTGISFDRGSYASVLVGLQRAIVEAEARVIPCVTAVCPGCNRVSLISDGTLESGVRTVAMWRRLAEWVDT
jgi:hypothetical protein